MRPGMFLVKFGDYLGEFLNGEQIKIMFFSFDVFALFQVLQEMLCEEFKDFFIPIVLLKNMLLDILLLFVHFLTS